MTPPPPPTAGAFFDPYGWELLTVAHPCPYKGVGDPSPLRLASLSMTLRTLPAIRAEARRRGMVVVQQRRTMSGRGPVYHVYADHWGGRNLQRLAGDTTPEVRWLDGLPELLRWALRTWPDC